MANAVSQQQSRQFQPQPRSRSGFITVPQPKTMQEPEAFDHRTRTGRPDRRYAEYRALPPPEEEMLPNRARIGEVINGIHYTIDGKVDRRWKETRGLSDQDVAQLELQYLQMKAGGSNRR